MATEPAPLTLAPGVNLTDTEYFAQGRYVAADHVRFVDGLPEKIGGWEQWNEDGDELPDVCRSILCWMDYSFNLWHAFGTVHRLWVFDQDRVRTNITPFVATGTLANPFSTTDTLTTVNVNDAAHGVVVGQYVYFSGAAAVGGITIDGEYIVTVLVDPDNYQIEHSLPATSTAGPGGGAAVAYDYELAPGNSDISYGGGWGIGTWGSGTWGSFHASTTFIQYPRYWSLDKYGQFLLALPSGGTVYKWEVDIADRAEALTNAPTGLFMFVTYQRIIVVLGANDDLMNMAWCDDDDPTDWTPAPTNTANSRRLQEGTRMVAGARLSQEINLVWTDLSVYLMQYTGSNNVYATRALGLNTGLVGPNAFVVVDGVAYWMSGTRFLYYNGSVQEIPSTPDLRSIFDTQDPDNDDALSETYRVNTGCFYNAKFNEVWWLFTSRTASANDRYIILNLNDWSVTPGTIDRSVMGNEFLNGVNTPLGVDFDGVIYYHEFGRNADGQVLPWSLTSSYFDLREGKVTVNIDGYIPDMKRQTGTIDVRFQSREYPEDAADLHDETKQMAETDSIVDFRTSGRIIKLTLSQSELDGDFAMGRQRIEAGTSGDRRG